MAIGLIKVLKKIYRDYIEETIFKESYLVSYEILLKELLLYISEKIDNNNSSLNNEKIHRYFRQTYWSEKAFEKYKELKEQKIKSLSNTFIFEHVVPLNIIRAEITKLIQKESSELDILNFLNKYMVVCIILKEEDKKFNNFYKSNLGKPLKEDTIWNRYKENNINVFKVKTIKELKSYNLEKIEKIIF